MKASPYSRLALFETVNSVLHQATFNTSMVTNNAGLCSAENYTRQWIIFQKIRSQRQSRDRNMGKFTVGEKSEGNIKNNSI